MNIRHPYRDAHDNPAWQDKTCATHTEQYMLASLMIIIMIAVLVLCVTDISRIAMFRYTQHSRHCGDRLHTGRLTSESKSNRYPASVWVMASKPALAGMKRGWQPRDVKAY